MSPCLGLFISLLGLAGAGAQAGDSYQAGGRTIKVDLFAPPAGISLKGAAVVLHGAGGVIFDGPRMRRVARALAATGYDVSLIHFFDRTGTLVARDRGMQENFDLWQETVRKGIEHTRATRAAGRPVYVYGYSLGAFLAIAAASNNPGVTAVAEQAGGIWNNQKKRIGRMPPVLMLHGELDQRVPLEKYARPLLFDLKQQGVGVRTHFFPQEGHVFSASGLSEVAREVPLFFDTHPVTRRN